MKGERVGAGTPSKSHRPRQRVLNLFREWVNLSAENKARLRGVRDRGQDVEGFK